MMSHTIKLWVIIMALILSTLMWMYILGDDATASPSREEMEDYARRTADLFDLSPELVLAVIEQESDWNVTCKSSAGCLGLMQLNPNTGKWCCEQMGLEWDPYDYQCNIACGCYYLDYLRSEWKKFDIDDEDITYFVLISYNRGIMGANKWISSNNIETNKYAMSVLEKKTRMEMEKIEQLIQSD